MTLQQNNCSNAHLTTNGTASLEPTVLYGNHSETHPGMTQDTLLKVCFATLESYGESADDYIELPTVFIHRKPPSLDPDRFAQGTGQLLQMTDTGGGMIGGIMYFTQKRTACDETTPSYTRTREYTFTDDQQQEQPSAHLQHWQ